jgi:hypothetical protein
MCINPASLKHEHNAVRRWLLHLTLSGDFRILTPSRRLQTALKI